MHNGAKAGERMISQKWMTERIEHYLEHPRVRGIQVSVVKEGETATFAAGLRNAAGDAVSTETVFPIGSTTKAFTAVAIGICVDRGLLDWDDRIKEFIPWFDLMDEYAGDHLTIRDALCHRSGLPRHEFSWMGAPVDTVGVIHRLKYLPPNYGFRTEYRYNNQMYAMLGHIVSIVSGMPFADFLAENINVPLGMNNTCFSVDDIPSVSDDFATPFMQTPEGIIDIPYFNIDNIGGAGLINSTAEDMLLWMSLQLQQGNYDGQQLISAASLRETQTPQIVANNSRFFNTPDFDLRSYSMGWYVESYRGVTQLRHTGGINGFFSQVTLIPKKHIGVTVMVNTCGGDVTGPVLFELIDDLAGYEPRDWETFDKTQSETMKQGMGAINAQILSFKNLDAKPSRQVADFAGNYQHKGYGEVNFSLENEILMMHFNIYHVSLQHLNNDTYYFDYEGMAVPVQFLTDANGYVSGVGINMEHEMKTPIVFERIAA
jgi:CubicO group peptidase (beta-lactamase class C family)